MTAALERCGWSAARPGRTLSPGKTRYPFYRGLSGPHGQSGRAENLAPPGKIQRILCQITMIKLCPCVKEYRGVEMKLRSCLTFALDGNGRVIPSGSEMWRHGDNPSDLLAN